MTTPLMLVFMMAAMAGMLPSLELTNVTALIPVANIFELLKLFTQSGGEKC